MKNPKILPFESWFKVYESAGKNFNKSMRIMESKLQNGIQAIYESSISEIQNKAASMMDEVAKACFGRMDAVHKKSVAGLKGTSGQKLKKKVDAEYSRAMNNLVEAFKDSSDFTEDDLETSWKLGKISGVDRDMSYNNAKGSIVYASNLGAMDVDLSSELNSYNNAIKLKDGKADIYDLFMTMNSENIRQFFVEVENASGSTISSGKLGYNIGPNDISWKQPDKYGWEINTDMNLITDIDKRVALGEYSVGEDTPEFASGFKPSTMIDADNGEAKISAPFYTVVEIVPQGGVTIQGNEWLSSVVVVSEEQAVEQPEQPLEDVGELFVVGKSDWKGNGAEVMKKRIQKVFNTFKSVASVKVKGGASKEGSLELNKTLVDGRAAAVANLIKSTWKNIPTTAISGEYDKIQTEGEIDPKKRTVYLYIKGTKMVNVEKTLEATALQDTEFKSDLIKIKETIITCTFTTESSTWKKHSGKVAKKAANKDEDWNSLNVGDEVRLKVTGKDGKEKKVTREIIQVKGEGKDKVLVYLTPNKVEKEATRDQFVNLSMPEQQIKNVKRSLGIGSKKDL